MKMSDEASTPFALACDSRHEIASLVDRLLVTASTYQMKMTFVYGKTSGLFLLCIPCDPMSALAELPGIPSACLSHTSGKFSSDAVSTKFKITLSSSMRQLRLVSASS